MQLYDWESHADSRFDLCDGLNVVIGLSHEGKSGFVRSIDWVVNNNPIGTSYFPRGVTNPNTIVSAEFSDDSFITRNRSSRKNVYETEDGEFSALKSGVPEQVSEIFNMTELNIQLQKDVHFMLTESPGKRAKMLNEVAGLSEMDKAIDSANKLYRSTKSEYDSLTVQLSDKESKRDELSWLDKADEEFAELEKANSAVEALTDKYNKIYSVLNKIEEIDRKISELPPVDALVELEVLFSKNKKIEELNRKYNELVKRVDALIVIENAINDITLPDDNEIAKIEAVSAQIAAKENRKGAIRAAISKITVIDANIVKMDKTVSELSNQLTEYVQSYDICPFCNAEIKR